MCSRKCWYTIVVNTNVIQETSNCSTFYGVCARSHHDSLPGIKWRPRAYRPMAGPQLWITGPQRIGKPLHERGWKRFKTDIGLTKPISSKFMMTKFWQWCSRVCEKIRQSRSTRIYSWVTKYSNNCHSLDSCFSDWSHGITCWEHSDLGRSSLSLQVVEWVHGIEMCMSIHLQKWHWEVYFSGLNKYQLRGVKVPVLKFDYVIELRDQKENFSYFFVI